MTRLGLALTAVTCLASAPLTLWLAMGPLRWLFTGRLAAALVVAGLAGAVYFAAWAVRHPHPRPAGMTFRLSPVAMDGATVEAAEVADLLSDGGRFRVTRQGGAWRVTGTGMGADPGVRVWYGEGDEVLVRAGGPGPHRPADLTLSGQRHGMVHELIRLLEQRFGQLLIRAEPHGPGVWFTAEEMCGRFKAEHFRIGW